MWLRPHTSIVALQTWKGVVYPWMAVRVAALFVERGISFNLPRGFCYKVAGFSTFWWLLSRFARRGASLFSRLFIRKKKNPTDSNEKVYFVLCIFAFWRWSLDLIHKWRPTSGCDWALCDITEGWFAVPQAQIKKQEEKRRKKKPVPVQLIAIFFFMKRNASD